MDTQTLIGLTILLVILISLSAFFAGTETALMAVNRYRLRHLANQGHRGARYAEQLLTRPDRLIGMILLGNIAVHSASTAIATFITLRLWGEPWIAATTGVLTLFILIFGEIAPKTLSALHPERVALASAYIYKPLLWVLHPILILVNWMSNGVLRMFGVSPDEASHHSLSAEELRTVVAEAGAMIPARHQKMLLSILDLEKATVEDIMVPRSEIVGIDLSEPWEVIREAIISSSHTRLPVWDGGIDHLKGVVHLRKLVRVAAQGQLSQETLMQYVREAYFIPEGTALNQQLLQFQEHKRRVGFVVDEYGDIQGLVTLDDILEEVVGEFTSDPATRQRSVTRSSDGSITVSATLPVRNINRAMNWTIPMVGPRTLNGRIAEALGHIPKPGRKLRVGDYEIEVLEAGNSAVKTVRIRALPSEGNAA